MRCIEFFFNYWLTPSTTTLFTTPIIRTVGDFHQWQQYLSTIITNNPNSGGPGMQLAYRTCLSQSPTLAVPSWTTLSTGGENLSLPGFKGDDIAYGGTICCWYCVIANSSSIRGHCPLSQSCLGGFKIYSFIGVHLRVVQKLPLPIYLICRYLFSKIYKTINI